MASNPVTSFVGHYAKTPSPIPGMYNGMRVEVLDHNGILLFVADAQVMNKQMVELVRTSAIMHSGIADGMAVSVRGFNAYDNCGVHLDGKLSRLSQGQDSAWLVKDLDLKGKDTGRSYSRRPIEAQAWVLPENGPDWLECRVVNASAGGVCFRTYETYQSGQRLSIRFRLRRGKEQPPLTIEVRRVVDTNGVYEYGCEFVDLNSEVDTIITKTIIELQIMQK